jgi:zinc D-Ala-D-Ala dipeptidase
VARVADYVVGTVTVLLLLAARGSSTIQTPERGSASRADIPENEYGLGVIEDKDLYHQAVADAASRELVELQEEVSGIHLDIRYATENNFMDEQLYPVVADPGEGSRYNRGCAVDLTLIEGNIEELLMPPNFENSSERTGCGYEDLSEDAIRNRDLLREVIKSHGFVALET